MLKWIGGIVGAVITAVAIAYFTDLLPGSSPAPSPPIVIQTPAPERPVVGYLVSARDTALALERLGPEDRICGTRTALAAARGSADLGKVDLLPVGAGELYQAFQQGICKGLFVVSQSDADRLFPTGTTDLRLTPVH